MLLLNGIWTKVWVQLQKTAQKLNYECEEIIIWCPGRFGGEN